MLQSSLYEYYEFSSSECKLKPRIIAALIVRDSLFYNERGSLLKDKLTLCN